MAFDDLNKPFTRAEMEAMRRATRDESGILSEVLALQTVVVVVMFLSADMPVHTLGLMEASEQRLERCSVTPGNTNQ